MKVASRATAAARNPQVDGVCQEWVVALEKPYTPQNSAAHTATVPGRSSRGPGRGEEPVKVRAPPRGQVLDQHAPEQHPHRGAGADDPGVDPQRGAALLLA